jgi:hypothetical protein
MCKCNPLILIERNYIMKMGWWYNLKVKDPTTAQEINHQALYAEVRFLSKAIPRGICGRQNGTGRDFSRSASVLLFQTLPVFHIYSPICHRLYINLATESNIKCRN